VLRASDLRTRDVISAADGKRLGFVEDLEIDPSTGRVIALIVPRRSSWWGLLGRQEEHIIPWSEIKTIGADVILVDVGSHH